MALAGGKLENLSKSREIRNAFYSLLHITERLILKKPAFLILTAFTSFLEMMVKTITPKKKKPHKLKSSVRMRFL